MSTGGIYIDPHSGLGRILGRSTTPTAAEEMAEPRPSAAAINSAPRRAVTASATTGDGAAVPLLYGRQPLAGDITLWVQSGGYLYVRVGWCWGVVQSIDKLFIDGVAPGAGVEVRHYRGTTTQGVDSWLAAVVPGYDDDMVYRRGSHTLGVAYSVLKIAAGALDRVNRIEAIVSGLLVADPDLVSTDPYAADNALSVDFQTGGTDTSPHGHTITLVGGATIDSGGLQLPNGG